MRDDHRDLSFPTDQVHPVGGKAFRTATPNVLVSVLYNPKVASHRQSPGILLHPAQS